MVEDCTGSVDSFDIETDGEDNVQDEDLSESVYFKSSGGRELWTPKCAEKLRPYCNQYFPSIEKAYEFYREYGHKCGFDVRKNTTRKDREGKLRVKYIVCSHAGAADSASSVNSFVDEQRDSKCRRTASRRCHCEAKIILKYRGPSGFAVISFVEEHNHELLSGDSRKFLRCSRQLSFGTKNFIVDVGRANIGAKRAHSVMKELCGSYDNVSATATDYKNFSRDLRLRIGNHDADMIIDKFKNRSELTNNAFFYDFKVDTAGCLTGLFWADAIGRKNYSVFGDALAFDPTFRTNRYCMVFIPFTGVDNHWKNVTFAAALLEKEDFENFKWVIKAFEKAMDHVPKVVITDQCPAISKALRTVWGDIPHRLCMWHIMNKLSSKVGPTLASDKKFMDKFKAVVWADHLCTDEFEEGWQAVLKEYNLQNNSWLMDMYCLRSDWISAYFTDIPMGGLLRTTSRSESSNSFFQHFQKRGDTLVELFSRFESAMDKQRYGHSSDNKDSKLIPFYDKRIPIEKYAAKVYTRSLFNIVREQIQSGFYHTQISVINTIDGTKVFQIIDRLIRDRVFEVRVRMLDYNVDCSCKHYLRMGFLCRHAFAALHHIGVKTIPRKYVMTRWMKNADHSHVHSSTDDVSQFCDVSKEIKIKVNDMWFDFHSCINKVGMNVDKVDKMHSRMKTMKEYICALEDDEGCNQDFDDLNLLVGTAPHPEIIIQNPNISRNKGCGSRIKSGRETAMESSNEKRRRCSRCGKIEGHNARNCPLDKK